MPTLVACLWRRVEAIQPGRVPTHFGPATRLRRPESQWNQGALATSQVEMCPRTANSGLADAPLDQPPLALQQLELGQAQQVARVVDVLGRALPGQLVMLAQEGRQPERLEVV